MHLSDTFMIQLAQAFEMFGIAGLMIRRHDENTIMAGSAIVDYDPPLDGDSAYGEFTIWIVGDKPDNLFDGAIWLAQIDGSLPHVAQVTAAAANMNRRDPSYTAVLNEAYGITSDAQPDLFPAPVPAESIAA